MVVLYFFKLYAGDGNIKTKKEEKTHDNKKNAICDGTSPTTTTTNNNNNNNINNDSFIFFKRHAGNGNIKRKKEKTHDNKPYAIASTLRRFDVPNVEAKMIIILI